MFDPSKITEEYKTYLIAVGMCECESLLSFSRELAERVITKKKKLSLNKILVAHGILAQLESVQTWL